MDNNNKAKEYALFHINRKVTNLYKNILIVLEDSPLPPESYQKIRKRVLDYGNDTIRELKEIFDQGIDIKYKD